MAYEKDNPFFNDLLPKMKQAKASFLVLYPDLDAEDTMEVMVFGQGGFGIGVSCDKLTPEVRIIKIFKTFASLYHWVYPEKEEA